MSLSPRTQKRMASAVVYDWNLSAENVETGRSLDLSGRPAKLTSCQILGKWEPVISKTKQTKNKMRNNEIILGGI